MIKIISSSLTAKKINLPKLTNHEVTLSHYFGPFKSRIFDNMNAIFKEIKA